MGSTAQHQTSIHSEQQEQLSYHDKNKVRTAKQIKSRDAKGNGREAVEKEGTDGDVGQQLSGQIHVSANTAEEINCTVSSLSST